MNWNGRLVHLLLRTLLTAIVAQACAGPGGNPEALLPQTLDGAVLTIETRGPPTAGTLEATWLDRVGADRTRARRAIGHPSDMTYVVAAFSAPGGSKDRLATEYTRLLGEQYGSVNESSIVLAGRSVTRLTADGDLIYVFVRDDVLYQIVTSPERDVTPIVAALG